MAEESQTPQPTSNQKDVVVHDNVHGGKPNQVTLKPQQLGDIIMAEVDTIQLSQEHADIRREAAEHTSDIRREGSEHTAELRYDIGQGTNESVKETLKAGWANTDATKDARFGVISTVEAVTDRIVDRVEEGKDALMARTWDMGRDLSDIRAQIVSQQQATLAGFLGVSKDSEINALKTQMATAKQTTYLSDKIDGQAERTRELINALNDQSLNRQLIERNSEIVAERDAVRHWRGNYDNAQFNALTTQLNSFQSQLQETRQGMVNFGTMAGVGQSSTSNNVR